MLSIIGRRDAPKGVLKNSRGRSMMSCGIEHPVKKFDTSFVKVLQLNSVKRIRYDLRLLI